MKYFVSFVIVARPAAYDGFVLKLELPCRLRVSVVSYCGLLAFDARDAWPQTGGSLIESGEDGLWSVAIASLVLLTRNHRWDRFTIPGRDYYFVPGLNQRNYAK